MYDVFVFFFTVDTVYPRLFASGNWAQIIPIAFMFSEDTPLVLNVIGWCDNAGRQTFYKMRFLDHNCYDIWPRNRSSFETLLRFIGGEHQLDQVCFQSKKCIPRDLCVVFDFPRRFF